MVDSSTITATLALCQENLKSLSLRKSNQFCCVRLAFNDIPKEFDYKIANLVDAKIYELDPLEILPNLSQASLRGRVHESFGFNYRESKFKIRDIPDGPGYLFFEYHEFHQGYLAKEPVKKLQTYLSINPIGYRPEIEKFQKLEEFKITISNNIEFIDKIILKIREFESLYNLK